MSGKTSKSNSSYLITFFRTFNPKKYRLLTMNGFLSVFTLFSVLCAICTISVILWNYENFTGMFSITSSLDSVATNPIDNSFLLNILYSTFSGDSSIAFFIFLVPSLLLYVFLYLLIKYFLIALVTGTIFYLVFLFFKNKLKFIQSIKISLYSATIMILFDCLNVVWYSRFFVSFVLFLILNIISAYFVTSDSV